MRVVALSALLISIVAPTGAEDLKSWGGGIVPYPSTTTTDVEDSRTKLEQAREAQQLNRVLQLEEFLRNPAARSIEKDEKMMDEETLQEMMGDAEAAEF